MLQHWLQRCWPTSEVARNRLCAQRCLPCRPWPSRLLYPPAPHRMRVRFCLLWGGAFCWLCHCLHHRLPPAARSKRYAAASDLAIALDVATVLARPVLSARLFPPTLNQCGGGASTPISAVPTLLAHAISIPCSESARASSPTCLVTPSQLLSMMASSSPSLQPFDVKNAVSMLLDVGGAHPFRGHGLPLPPRKRLHGRRHPCRVC